MTLEEINSYRKLLETEYTAKDVEIETSLSYISVGALGFFLTINEKFIVLKEAHFRVLLIISLVLLFSSFILVLYRKSKNSEQDLKMMQEVDKLQPNSNDDAKLLEFWNKCHGELCRIRRLIYFCLGTGIGVQVLFLLLNVYA